MSKAETTAIIDSLRASIQFLMTNGVGIRQPISDPTADAAHVADLLSSYDTAIDTIISDIPDDPETPDAES